jgi:hypothetical protein
LINKRKILLDQLREGLKVLGVLDEITKHPEILEPLFVANGESLSPTSVKSMLSFPSDTENNVVRQMLLRFIDEGSVTGKSHYPN